MKKVALSLLLLIQVHFIYSQTSNPVKLPEILPPSPDAAALIKAGMGGVNYSTGAISTNVPLYDLKVGSVSMPVSVSYSSQGIKVDENCSRVGQGWVLNAGGVVSRHVLGQPDELATRTPVPSDLSEQSSTNWYYFNNSGSSDPTSTFDTQPDEFRFNFNGYSGKFVLDDNRNPVIISHSNVKIQVDISNASITTITITTPDGIKYYFGGTDAFEETVSVNMNYKIHTKTAFYLYKTELLTGENINFTYTPITITANVGFTETIVIPRTVGAVQCGTCPQDISQSVQSSKVTYDTKYLTGIQSTNGQQLTFTYEPMNDASNDVRLKGFIAASSGTIKKYAFTYVDQSGSYGATLPDGSVKLNGRFFLTKISQVDNQIAPNTPETLDYTFEYNEMANAGVNITSQDFFGYANGKTNTGLIPPIQDHTSFNHGDRTPDWHYSVKGILSKIIYPTGGREEFSYEPNTINVQELDPNSTAADFVQNGQGVGTDAFNTAHSVTYAYLTPLRNQTPSMLAQAYLDSTYTGSFSYPYSGTKIMYYKVYDLTSSTYILSAGELVMGLNGFVDQTNNISLTANHEYRFEMEVRGGSYIKGKISFTYNPSAEDIYIPVNKETGGVRLKQITSVEPITNKTVNKYFIYASLNDLNTSSGRGAVATSFLSQSSSIVYGSGTFPCYNICSSDVYSSNSSFSLFDYDGSNIYYKSIIETSDPGFANGGTEYVFYEPVNEFNGFTIAGNGLANLPRNTGAYLNGVKNITNVFDNTKKIISSQTDTYERVGIDNYVKAVYVRKNFAKGTVSSPAVAEDFLPFDVIFYQHAPSWIRLQSSATNTVDDNNNELTTLTEYTYGTYINGAQNNVGAKTITVTDSKNTPIVTTNKYPTDFAGDPVYDLMISKNKVSPVIESSTVKNITEINKVVTHYEDWFSDGKVLEPDYIQAKESSSGTLENRLIYAKYDATGNVRQVQKADDIKLVYLWDYLNSFVIAEVKNAGDDQVAYTSFETVTSGNWQPGSGGTTSDGGITGYKRYSGSLTKTVPSGNYIVTLWSLNSNVQVNGTAGTIITTKGQWQLFHWNLNSMSNITVSGNDMDEVRLYPEGSLMQTYAYNPFIGIESISDPNDKIVYYEYDFFNRLERIRDIDKNIIKQYSYKYNQPIGTCTNTTANWVATTVQRCVKNSNNNNTGVEEAEEKDMNNCSASFLQTRWVSLGTTGNCSPLANCSGDDKRVVHNSVTGIDECEAGVKVYLESVPNGSGGYTCYYRYEWSDGAVSETHSETSSTNCLNLN